MPKPSILARLRELNFNPELFSSVPNSYPDDFYDALLNYFDHENRYDSASLYSRLSGTLFYFERGDVVQLFQFYDQGCAVADYQSIELGLSDSLRLKFQKPKFYPTQRNFNGFIFTEIGTIRVDGSSPKWQEPVQQLGISFYKLPIKAEPASSSINTDPLEKALLENLEIIKSAVAEKGYWNLPEKVLSQFPQLRNYTVTSVNRDYSNESNFFKNAPLFLEKFCYFKIKEITKYSTGRAIDKPPEKIINLSVIQQTHTSFSINEARLEFSGTFVVSINNPRNVAATDVIDALLQSCWLVDDDKEMSIRLADQRLEDSLVVNLYCKGLNYGVSANQLKLSGKPKGLNFWEALATNIASQQAQDDSQMEVVTKGFEDVSKRLPAKPSLHPCVEAVARQEEGMKQKEFVTSILENRLAVRGTLLNLPTGYGKTFILLMAMAQHYRDAETKKPYLVVVPQDNVRTTWQENIKLMNDNDKLEEPPFVEACNCLFEIGDLENLKPKKVGDKKLNQIVIVTPKILVNCVAEMLCAIEKLGTKPTANDFTKRLREAKYFQLNACIDALLKGDKKIFSKRYFLIGDEKIWRPAVEVALRELNEPSQSDTRQVRNKEQNETTLEGVIRDLKRLRDFQRQQFARYANFKNKFNGIILDESHSILAASSTGSVDNKNKGGDAKSSFIVRDIVLDFAKTYQCEAILGNVSNRLIIASSATPWPNNMDELRLHLRFLYPKLLGEFSNLNEALFKGWKKFEDFLAEYQTISGNVTKVIEGNADEDSENNDDEEGSQSADQSAGEEDIENQENSSTIGSNSQANNTQKAHQLSAHYAFVQNRFRKWVRLLFDKAIKYEPPGDTTTNKTDSQVIYVTCEPHPEVVSLKRRNVLRMIDDFYSVILGLRKVDTNSTGKDKRLVHGIASSNLYPQVQSFLPNMLTSPKKIAFYVAETADAALLAMRLADHYRNQGDNFIGFFYNDDFVKKQEGVKPEYELVTYNTDKDVNRNAFNNIFAFNDFFCFLTQFFGFRKGGHDLLYNATTSFKKLMQPILDLFRGDLFEAGKPNWQTKRQKLRSELQKPQYKKSMLAKLSQLCIKYADENKCHVDHLDANLFDESEFIKLKFLQTIVALEQRSQQEIISDFKEVLTQFSEYLPRSNSNADVIEQFKIHYRTMIRDVTQANANGILPNSWLSDGFFVFRYLLLAYLYKIYRSNILIFGPAGTAGMRLDADQLTLLSGAWTEGRLTQIKGRVGRLKGQSKQARHCKILLPITNTSFELKILQYYIKKSLYHFFITNKQLVSPEEICLPLWLSTQLGLDYERRFSDKQIIDAAVHSKIRAHLGQNAEGYLALEPFEKALKLIPDELQTLFNQFQALIKELLPVTPSGVDAVDDSMHLDEDKHVHQDITESWGVEYSDWIKLYAIERGWKLTNKLEARSIIEALVPEQKFNVTIKWRPPGHPEQMILDQPELLQQEAKPLTCLMQMAIERNEQNIVVINRQNIEKYFSRDDSVVVSVDWSEFQFEEFYLELVSNNNLSTITISVEPIEINGTQYVAYASLCGGNQNDSTHFWTYRSSQKGHYECDDVKPKILFTNRPLSLPANTRFIRFVRADKFVEACALLPKRLHNRNNNCYINASYQLVETKNLRNEIQKYINEYQSIPRAQVDDLELTVAGSDQDDSRPNRVPQIEPVAFPEPEILLEHANDANWILIISIPTRGCAPDIPYEEFVTHLNKVVLSVEEKLKSFSRRIKIYLIYGINIEQTRKQELIDRIQQLNLNLSDRVMTVMKPFLWRNEDRWKGIPPLGQMRNYCMRLARGLWQDLTRQHPSKKNLISYISMDGDTKISPLYLQKMWMLIYMKKAFISTAGYEMSLEELSESDPLQTPPESSGNAELWQDTWTKVASRISININAQLTYKVNDLIWYFGYFSEPMIVVSPKITEILMSIEINCASDRQSPYGFWDGEGRRFLKYTTRLVAEAQLDSSFVSYAPLKDRSERSVLVNFERFRYKCSLPSFGFKQQLTRDQLAEVIRLLHSQPQHSIKPYFMGSNIASALSVPLGPVRHFASYFYIKAFLMLLMLGPKRSFEFSNLIYRLYTEDNFNLEQNYEKEIWQVNITELNNFIAKNFAISPQVPATEHIRRYAPLLATWTMAVSEQLLTWFCEEYQEEKDSDLQFTSMQLPESYPRDSIRIVEQDVQVPQPLRAQVVDHGDVIAKLKKYITDNITFDLCTNAKVMPLREKYAGTVHEIGSTTGGIVAIMSFHGQLPDDELRERSKNLLSDIKKIYKNTFVQIITVVHNEDKIPFEFGYYSQGQVVISNEIPEDIATHNFFELAELRKYFSEIDNSTFVNAPSATQLTTADVIPTAESNKRPHSADNNNEAMLPYQGDNRFPISDFFQPESDEQKAKRQRSRLDQGIQDQTTVERSIAENSL